ncbi:hypothetical protein [Pseudomonas sp. BMS12]|uniref:hypothetical protein n=1 Tax=Pseudomonas sp. BMS12 TaxID=1796033 RepID=UPI00083AF66D|nr:hypothetical protein [Pseudomonas sp. BMS12]
MSEHATLSREELDYIRQLFSAQLIGKPLPIPAFKVDGGPLANALLARLGLHAQLSLEAQLEHCRMSFPLHLVEDELHGLQLEMGAPSIFEEGAVLRPWRLTLKKPLALRAANGKASTMRVLELAPGSLLLQTSDGHPPPELFDLWLALPGAESMPIHGQLIRRTDSDQAAYYLQLQHREHAERIRQFLFEQYRERNPQLQATG